MSITIKPRRGSATTMSTTKKGIVLSDGELFIEKPDNITGNNQYKLKIGDGVTTYENLKYAIDPSSIVTTPSWSSVSSKPFSTVGSGLTVSSDALTANVQSVALTNFGTASSSSAAYQGLSVNGATSTKVAGSIYMEYSQTVSTSTTTTYTFTNSTYINSSSAIDVYSSIWGYNPTSVTISGSTCTVVFPAYTSASSVKCRIYIR